MHKLKNLVILKEYFLIFFKKHYRSKATVINGLKHFNPKFITKLSIWALRKLVALFWKKILVAPLLLWSSKRLSLFYNRWIFPYTNCSCLHLFILSSLESFSPSSKHLSLVFSFYPVAYLHIFILSFLKSFSTSSKHLSMVLSFYALAYLQKVP